ncbi:MAG TPA: DUF2911 domain-containing protein [Terriglobia bacterium]|nr:DUF2911 domain-containing protein [Terriglobia bacterium]
MKKSFLVISAVAALLVATAACFAQGNGRGTAKLTLDGATVTVEYGTPSLKGRAVKDLLGSVGAGDFWRLGADKSTTFSTTKDLQFGDVTVPKGEYSLWAEKQSDGSWKLVFNKQHGQWGTQHDPAQDFASVPLKQETEGKSAEKVTITLEKENGAGELSVQWGDMEMTANFSVK